MRRAEIKLNPFGVQCPCCCGIFDLTDFHAIKDSDGSQIVDFKTKKISEEEFQEMINEFNERRQNETTKKEKRKE